MTGDKVEIFDGNRNVLSLIDPSPSAVMAVLRDDSLEAIRKIIAEELCKLRREMLMVNEAPFTHIPPQESIMNEQRPVITKLEALLALILDTQSRDEHNYWYSDDFDEPRQLVEEALLEARKESIITLGGNMFNLSYQVLTTSSPRAYPHNVSSYSFASPFQPSSNLLGITPEQHRGEL